MLSHESLANPSLMLTLQIKHTHIHTQEQAPRKDRDNIKVSMRVKLTCDVIASAALLKQGSKLTLR